jgi:single-strand DNA-binding protein
MSLDNEFRIHGNLVKDVRRGRTANGTTTAFYVVAVSHQFQAAEGLQKTTDFIPITTYGKQAESDLKYLAKGKEVMIRGRIRSWYDSAQGRGGFAFEPDPGCVGYIGAPVAKDAAPVIDGEHDDWLRDYDAAAPEYDAAPQTTRPARMAAPRVSRHACGLPQ